MILMMEMVLGGGPYDEIYWKWSAQWEHLLGRGHQHGDPKGDPRGDPYVANDPAKYSLLRAP